MTENELKKLNRTDLLRMLIEQKKLMEQYQAEAADRQAQLIEENEKLKAQLEDRTMRVEKAGSLADAAISINGVLEAAQRSADDYLMNIKLMYQRQDEFLAAQKQAAEEEIRTKKLDNDIACARKLEDTERECRDMVQRAEANVDAYWNQLSERMGAYYEAHRGLQEMLGSKWQDIAFSDENRGQVLDMMGKEPGSNA